MKKRFSKKGYFFIIDAVLALGVLAVGLFLIFSAYTKIPPKEQIASLSEDMMDFFTQNKIKDVNNDYAGVGGELWNNGKITNSENTLLQQTAIFYNGGNFTIMENFVRNLTQNILPVQYVFELRINKTLVYPMGPSQRHNISKNKTTILIPSRKIVHGFSDSDEEDMFGPYLAEVLTWQNIN
ncbi:hypothetical protein ISS07_03790 [Candidatus Woesearchaeota archaeon]|nr:hypothetical protein [Candidatus Woesearchaeota archaeon]